MTTIYWIELALGAAVLCVAIWLYNSLIALQRRCDQAAADIDVQLKQRHDLIPNLVETVKGYAGHERGTLEAVIKARNAAMTASPAGQLQAEAALGGAIGRLMALAESYPELRASANFAELQGELADTENKIAAARRYLNNVVNEYNTTREQFPGIILARLYGFPARSVEIVSPDARAQVEAAPVVRF